MSLANSPVICEHFGECGGCQSQDMAYAAQVEQKQSMLGELYKDYWTGTIPVYPSPVIWNYRNKVDPAFAPMQYPEPPPPGFQRETVLGFKRKGRWFWPLDIQECRIGPPRLGELLAGVRAWVRERGHHAYDQRTGEGMLRNLLVRTAPRTGESMVVLITRSGAMRLDGFVEVVNESFGAVSIQRGTTDRKADIAVADTLELLAGKDSITAQMEISSTAGMLPLQFRISPMSFFQTNTLATEQLYGEIRAWVSEAPASELLDLYGGSGGIAFSCADLVGRVRSVEEVLPASEDGRHNASLNGIPNVEFETSDVRAWLKRYLREGAPRAGVTAIVDPPRAGLHPKVLRRLVELAPERLLYVSCNPKILAQECAVLAKEFRLARIVGFDLFPHTRHVETLALFERR